MPYLANTFRSTRMSPMKLRDLDILEGRTITNRVKFNRRMCQNLHLGQGNSVYTCMYSLGDERLKSSLVEAIWRPVIGS